MTKTVSGLFDTYQAASAAVSALESAGVPHSDISIVANNSDKRHGGDTQRAADDAGTGATVGTAVGGLGGLLAGLGMLAIPGVGPVVAAGWLVSTALGAGVGAAVGGATGGIIGAMTESGIPERDAHVYAEGVRRGGTLVTARVDDMKASQAESILQNNKRVDVSARGAAYRESGWSSFDQSAPAYTSDEVMRERQRYNAS